MQRVAPFVAFIVLCAQISCSNRPTSDTLAAFESIASDFGGDVFRSDSMSAFETWYAGSSSGAVLVTLKSGSWKREDVLRMLAKFEGLQESYNIMIQSTYELSEDCLDPWPFESMYLGKCVVRAPAGRFDKSRERDRRVVMR